MRCSWLALLLCVAAGCSKQTEPALRRVALLPIENLEASHDGRYAADAVRLGIWEALQGQPAVYAAMANHRREVPELLAIPVDGYLANGRFHVRLGEKRFECAGSVADCAGRLAGELAGALGVTARAIPKGETLERMARQTALDRAAADDPGFASVWITWSAAEAREHGADGALAVLAKAPVTKMDPLDAWRVRVRVAELQRDRKGHAAAMRELARLAPADVALQERAARELTSVRDFPGALALYESLAKLAGSPPVLNQAAYLAALAGDRAKAEQYAGAAQTAAPLDAQYLDTRGEIAYYFGDYRTAAQFFEQSVALNIAFQNGIDLWKAADAARLAGEPARADALARRFFEFREKAGPTLILQAVWAWRRENPEEALMKLREASGSTARGKALFLRALMALHQRQAGAAEQSLREMEPQAAEAMLLRSLLADVALPSGFPVPAEALAALRLYLKGDNAGARTALAKARENMEPLQEGQWKKLAALLDGRKPEGLLPPSPDDWLAVLLR